MNIIDRVRQKLTQAGDETNRQGAKRYFKEEIRVYGVKNSEVHRVARECFREIKTESKDEIFNLCEELWKSGFMEESFVACDWSYSVHKHYQPSDMSIFERWVNNYVSNWASCDTLCNHTVGTLVEMYPQEVSKLKSWALAENRWMRRGAAVSLIVPARAGLFLKEIFKIADTLLQDKDDLVQKGYGWMLKAASEKHNQKEVFDFVMSRKGNMPRTALRYAIEKMPQDLRAQAMAKPGADAEQNN